MEYVIGVCLGLCLGFLLFEKYHVQMAVRKICLIEYMRESRIIDLSPEEIQETIREIQYARLKQKYRLRDVQKK